MAKRIRESRTLRTTVEVLEVLGGFRTAALLTGAQVPNAELWQRTPTFPSRYFFVMSKALRKKGFSAPPELWGQVTPAQRRAAISTMVETQKRLVKPAQLRAALSKIAATQKRRVAS